MVSPSENGMAGESVVAEKNSQGQADTCSQIGGFSAKTAPQAQRGEGANLDSPFEFDGETGIFVDLCREEKPWQRCIAHTRAGDLGQWFFMLANIPSIEVGSCNTPGDFICEPEEATDIQGQDSIGSVFLYLELECPDENAVVHFFTILVSPSDGDGVLAVEGVAEGLERESEASVTGRKDCGERFVG